MNERAKHILCAVDFSLASDAVIRYAAETLARDSELSVLFIAPEAEKEEGLGAMHLHEFSRYSDILAQHKVTVRFAVRYGEPAAGILDFAAEHGASMIILGSHGSRAIGRLLVGGTAESVMRRATCPVVILKMPENSVKAESAPLCHEILQD